MTSINLATVPSERLRLSPAPTSELAAGAMHAQRRAGLEDAHADFVIVAVPAGESDTAATLVAQALGIDLEQPDRRGT